MATDHYNPVTEGLITGVGLGDRIRQAALEHERIKIAQQQEARMQQEEQDRAATSDLNFKQLMMQIGAQPIDESGATMQSMTVPPTADNPSGDPNDPSFGVARQDIPLDGHIIRKADKSRTVGKKGSQYELPTAEEQHARAQQAAMEKGQQDAAQKRAIAQQELDINGVTLPPDIAKVLGIPPGQKVSRSELPGLISGAKNTAELPGALDEAQQKQAKGRAQWLGAMTTPESYAAAYKGVPDNLKPLFPSPETFDPATTPAIVRRVGMSPEDQAKEAAPKLEFHTVTEKGKTFLASYDPATGKEVKRYGDGTTAPNAADIRQAREDAKKTEERHALAKVVIDNPSLYDNLTPTEKGALAPELAKAGFSGFGKPMAESAITKLSDARSAIDSLNDLKTVLKENEQYIGPVAGYQALVPWSDARKAQAKIDLIKQRVGKALEGGVLRKEDEDKYKKILATLNDTPSTAIFKVDNVIKNLENDIVRFTDEQKRAGRKVVAPEGGQIQKPTGKIVVTAPDGSQHPFETQAQADAFKKLAGIQ